METFTLEEMQEMQRQLQERYKDKWEPVVPETGKNKMLWMVGEIGEAADIIKKHGVEALRDEKLRRWLVEELADVLMYYNDILLCYGITPAELKAVYREKFEWNMHRW